MMLFSYDFMASQLNQKNLIKQQSVETGQYHLNIQNLKLNNVVDSFDHHWTSLAEGVKAINADPEVSIELNGFTLMSSIHQYLQLSLNQDELLAGSYKIEFSNQKEAAFYDSDKRLISELKAPIDLSELIWTSHYPEKINSPRQEIDWSEIGLLDALVIRFYDIKPVQLILTGVMIEQNNKAKFISRKLICNQPIELFCFVTNRMRFNHDEMGSTQSFIEYQTIISFKPWVWLLASWLTVMFILKISGVQNVYAYALVATLFFTVLSIHQNWMLNYGSYFKWLLLLGFIVLLWFKRACLAVPKNMALGLLIPTLMTAAVMLAFSGKVGFLNSLPAYFIWALIQQLLLGPLFTDHLHQQLKIPGWLTACLVGVLFSILHAPNHMLMLATLVAGISWSWAWLKYQNIYANALSHALLALLYYQVMPDAWLGSARIGVFF